MILQKEIQTSKETILVIGGLPEDAKILRIVPGCLTLKRQNDNLDTFDYAIPPGKWQPLEFLKDITEDMAKELVDNASIEDILIYWNYIDECWFDDSMTALDSLDSIIQTNCKLKNKYGEMMPELEPVCCEVPVTDRNGYPECCGMPVPTEGSVFLKRLWQEEQSKVFTNPYLLKKI